MVVKLILKQPNYYSPTKIQNCFFFFFVIKSHAATYMPSKKVITKRLSLSI